MAELDEGDPLDELVGHNFRISKREYRDFKVWCAERGTT